LDESECLILNKFVASERWLSTLAESMAAIIEQTTRRRLFMSKALNKVAVIMMLGLTAIGTAQARGVPERFGGHYGHMGPPLGYVSQQSVVPQFNNPGPQISIPQCGGAAFPAHGRWTAGRIGDQMTSGSTTQRGLSCLRLSLQQPRSSL
jgi:hypothetical protein